MIVVSSEQLDRYLSNDSIIKALKSSKDAIGSQLTCTKWLTESPAKRYIFNKIYGDLFKEKDVKVIDIGGGLTHFTKNLNQAHDYTLVDILAHDNAALVETYLQDMPGLKLFQGDWLDFPIKAPVDVVIANDLFPNVDQRLELFLNKFLPLSQEIRLSLTYYTFDKYYKTKRVDADEILFYQAWKADQLNYLLSKFDKFIEAYDADLLHEPNTSVFPNSRQVVLLSLKNR